MNTLRERILAVLANSCEDMPQVAYQKLLHAVTAVFAEQPEAGRVEADRSATDDLLRDFTKMVDDDTAFDAAFEAAEWVNEITGARDVWDAALRFAALRARGPGGDVDERAEFEKWAAGRDHPVNKYIDACYANPRTSDMWQAWQSRSRVGR